MDTDTDTDSHSKSADLPHSSRDGSLNGLKDKSTDASTDTGNARSQHGSLVSRRRMMGAAVAVTAVAPVLPSRWTKPVIDSILLPAHAQTSGCVVVAGLLIAATTRTTTPSGATAPETSIATLTFAGCSCEPGASVTITAEPEISGASVGAFTGTSTADAAGAWTVVVRVPAIARADIANLTALPFTGTASGDAAADLPDAIDGVIPAPVCAL